MAPQTKTGHRSRFEIARQPTAMHTHRGKQAMYLEGRPISKVLNNSGDRLLIRCCNIVEHGADAWIGQQGQAPAVE